MRAYVSKTYKRILAYAKHIPIKSHDLDTLFLFFFLVLSLTTSKGGCERLPLNCKRIGQP